MSVNGINRSPTPIIRQTSAEDAHISQNSLAIIRTCYCSRVMSPGHVEILGTMSPSNDEVNFFYKGAKYKVFVSGTGVFYLGINKKGELILVRDKKIQDFPCCDPKFRNLMSFV